VTFFPKEKNDSEKKKVVLIKLFLKVFSHPENFYSKNNINFLKPKKR